MWEDADTIEYFKDGIRRYIIAVIIWQRDLDLPTGYKTKSSRVALDFLKKFQEEELFEDLEEFNKELMGYLIWYNGERPHGGLQKISPIKYLCYAQRKNPKEFQKIWTYTQT